MEMTGLKLIENTSHLLSNHVLKPNSPCESFSCGNESHRRNGPRDENRVEATVSNMPSGYVGDRISNENIDWGSEEYNEFRSSCEVSNGSSTSDASTPLILATRDKKICRTSCSQKVFDLDQVPLCGYTFICGRRPEMEDDVAIVPRFLQIPIQMLMDDCGLNGINQNPSHLTAHFFGVYDGHGGCQVAPETVGSTAVIAIICPTHIIVANCGDSRAVLCREK